MPSLFVRLIGGAGALLAFTSLVAGAACLAATLPGVEAPFAGFRYLDTGRVARVLEREWTGARAGLGIGDRVVAYDGRPWTTAAALDAHVAARAEGTPIRYVVTRPGAAGGERTRELAIPTQRFSTLNWTVTILAWWVVGTLSLLVAGVLLLARPQDPVALVHALILLGMGEMLAVFNPDGMVVHRLIGEAAIVALIAGQAAASTLAALRFPRPMAGSRVLIPGTVALAGGMALAAALGGVTPGLELAAFAWSLLGSAAYLARLGWTIAGRHEDEVARVRAKWLGLGVVVTTASLCVPLVAMQAGQPLPFAWTFTVLAGAFPIAVAIACARHGLADVDRLFRPTLLYALVAAMLSLAYFGMASAARALLGDQPLPTAVLATAAVTLAFAPLRDATRGWLDRTFFRRSYSTAAVAAALARQARERPDPDAVRAAYLEALDDALAPRGLAILELGAGGARPVAVRGEPLPPFEAPPGVDGAVAHAGGLAMPLAVDGPPFGLLVVGPKRAGLPMADEDRALVTTLGHQLALWLDLLARIGREVEQRRAIAALEAEERMHAEFLNLVSHELRTPASAVMQAVALIRQDADPARRETNVRRAQRNMEALTLLLDDLLQAGRLQLGGIGIAESEVDPAEVLREVVDQLAPLAEPRRMAIVVEAGPDLEPIWADRHRVAQVWRNLIHNALKYGREGGTVRVSLVRVGDHVRGEVRDDGPGVPAEDRPRLFQRFQPGVAAARKGGLGLGLYICRALVAAHGGEIGVEPDPAGGAAFWFTLPA